MRPINFKEANAQFEKPESMTDEECMPISAYIGEGHINTVWQPNKEDIEAINAGRPIVVSISGTILPPHSIFTFDENGAVNE